MPTRLIEQGVRELHQWVRGASRTACGDPRPAHEKRPPGLGACVADLAQQVKPCAALNIRYGNKNRSLRPIRARYCLCPGHRAQPVTFATTIERHSHELAR